MPKSFKNLGCCYKKNKDNEEVDDEGKEEDDEPLIENPCDKPYENMNQHTNYTWYPSVNHVEQMGYVRRLECEHEVLQSCLLKVTSQMARLQFRIRQIISAAPSDRDKLIADLERVVFKEFYSLDQCKEELPVVEQHHQKMGDIKDRQHSLIRSLRVRINDFKLASDGLPMQTDIEPEWQKSQAKSCSCPGESDSEEDESQVVNSKPRDSKTTMSAEDSRVSILTTARKSAGWEYNWEETASKSSQTDFTFGRNRKNESKI